MIQNRAGKFATPGLRGIQQAVSQLPKKVTSLVAAEDRRPAEDRGQARLPDRHVHLRDRADELGEGRRPAEVRLLGGHAGAEVRAAAPLPAAARAGAGIRVPRDQEDPGRLEPHEPEHVDARRRRGAGHRSPRDRLERRGLRLGDTLFQGIASAASRRRDVVLLGLIAYKVFDLAWPSIQQFGLSFVWTEAWDPVTETFGALTFVYGTVVTSLIALVLATPLSIAIALFLTEIAPRRLAAPIATLVELLAAIPSVVLGLWGILVFGPWIAEHLEPFLGRWLGFMPVLLGRPVPGGNPPGGARPDDHDRPDHVGDLSRALLARAPAT